MSQNVVGLDIGSYSIKLVELSREFRGSKYINAFQARIPLDPKVSREEAVRLVLEEQFSQEDLFRKTVICSFPGQFASTRMLTMPLIDRKKLDKMIPFEIENQIPMDLETIHHDWEILDSIEKTDDGNPAQSRILAVSILKERFIPYLNNLQNLDIEPREITLDSLALHNLIAKDHEDAYQCMALIDCGHSKTNICIVYEGRPLFTRSISVAGEEITRALEKDFRLSFLEAETMKLTDGLIAMRSGPGLSPESEKISQSIRHVVDDLAAEIRQTLVHFEEIYRLPIEEAHLFGGSAQLKNLATYLASSLDITIRRPNYLTEMDVHEFSDDQAYALLPALALALKGCQNKPNLNINFRKGDFRYHQSLDPIQGSAGKFIKLFGIVLVFFFLSFFVKSSLYSIQIKKYENKIQTQIKKIQPNYQFRGFQHAVSTLQTMVGGTSPAGGPYAKINQTKSPLIILQNISDFIPKNIPVTLQDISIDWKTIRFSGKTSSRINAEKIRENLAKNNSFKKVSIQKIDRINDQEFSFDVNISLIAQAGD